MTILRATNDGMKYIVEGDGSVKKAKASTDQLIFSEGTMVRISQDFDIAGASSDLGWVDLFDKEQDSYNVFPLSATAGQGIQSFDEFIVIPRDKLKVVFIHEFST